MPSVLISTFRKRISFQYTIVLILLAVLALALFLISVTTDEIDPFLEEVISFAFAMCIVPIIFIFGMKSSRLKALIPSDPSRTVSELESLIENERNRYQKTQTFRVIAGTLILAALITFLFIKAKTWLIADTFVLFIAVILLSMFQGWMLMQDGMMLQDIKHAMRDQPSDIS